MTYKSIYSTEYADRLQSDYGKVISNGLHTVSTAIIAGLENPVVEYVRVGQKSTTHDKPLFLINGYMAGIVANSPFAGEMASRGFDVILPNQKRNVVARYEDSTKSATLTQALCLSSVLEAAELTNRPIDVITHSYGSLVLDKLTEIAKEKDWSCFEGSKVAMMAPAGIKNDETRADFLSRYIKLVRKAGNIIKFDDGYWDFEDEMMAAGVNNFKQNVRLSLREGLEIMYGQVDPERLIKRGISKIAIVLNAEDQLFSYDTLETSMDDLLNENVTVFMPTSTLNFGLGMRGGTGADHNDHQFNPSRVGPAIEQFLRY